MGSIKSPKLCLIPNEIKIISEHANNIYKGLLKKLGMTLLPEP